MTTLEASVSDEIPYRSTGETAAKVAVAPV